MPQTGIKDPPLAINKPSPLPFATKFCWIVCEVWVLIFFSLIAHKVFDEMSKPHLSSHNTVSSAEVSNLIFFICN
jgi:hypothetical protein